MAWTSFNDFVKTKIQDSNVKMKGNVFVSFVVQSDGNVSDIKVIKSLSEECDKVATEIISETKSDWIEGIDEGQPVNSEDGLQHRI